MNSFSFSSLFLSSQKITFILILILSSFSYFAFSAQNATAFCDSMPNGMYCDANLSGFYRCTGDSRIASFQVCPTGTECGCFVGPECSTVPTTGYGSPCDYKPVLPNFPKAYISTFTGRKINSSSDCFINDTIKFTVLKATNGNQRVDIETISHITAGTCRVEEAANPQSVTYYYKFISTGKYNMYTYDKKQSTCTKSVTTTTSPPPKVADGFRALKTSRYPGTSSPHGSVPAQNSDVFYFQSGGATAGSASVYEEVMVSELDNGAVNALSSVRKEVLEGGALLTITTSVDTIKRIEPSPALFILPTSCQNI